MTHDLDTDSPTFAEKGLAYPARKTSLDGAASHISVVPVGRENLSGALPPHESYEGRHRWDPAATWTEDEERRVVRKTDLYLLSWLCVMVHRDHPSQKLFVDPP